MRTTIPLLIFFLGILAPFAHAAEKKCFKGVCFDPTVQIAGKKIPLLRATKFTYLFFDVYTIALYAPKGSIKDGSLLSDIPKQLVFNYHRDISRKEMIGGADKNLKENPKVNKRSIQKKLDQINAWYSDVSENDRYTLTFSPGAGLSLSKNGKLLGTVIGNDFANTYMGMWLSDFPLSNKLRRKLLGPM